MSTVRALPLPSPFFAALAVRGEPPASPCRRADRVHAALSQTILAGHLTSDTKLPPETELATHFRVSRPVVREALRRLREERLVISRRGSGSFVCAPPAQALDTPATSADINHILHGVELRQILEPEAAALAALRRTDEDLQRIGATVDAFAEAISNGAPTHAHDYGFHEAVARATANPRLLQAIKALEFDVSHAVKVWRHLGRMSPAMRLQDPADEHRAILECIRQHDAEGARRAMRTHLERARVRMISHG